jgi:Zn-finger nucleic acid-binding protein
MSSVGTLSCPRCAAPASPETARCSHCGTALALVACPACFARIFHGARHCSYCGAEAARAEPSEPRPPRACPRCREPLAPVRVGAVAFDECRRCAGLWAEVAALEQLLRDRETQAAVLGAAAPAPAASTAPGSQPYVPCPVCARLMNRLNFARCSGVLVDVCKGHGTWFDRDELRQIVAFVGAGGLARARAKEKEDLDLARRRLREQELQTRAARAASALVAPSTSSSSLDAALVVETLDAVATVGQAVWDWLSD